MDTKSSIFRILTVTPNLIQVEVLDVDQFKQGTKDFTIGSYLKISDDSNTSIIAAVQSFKIKETNSGGEIATTNPSFILDAQPIRENSMILKDGTPISYKEYYAPSGVHIEIQTQVTEEQKEEIKKTLQEERDLLSLKFLKPCKQ